MKTYKEIIVEFGSFRKTFRGIERMFPDVNQFLSVANRWILRGKRFKNPKLRKLMRRLKRKPDVSDMSKRDLKKVQDFVDEFELHDIESVRDVFSDYSDFAERRPDSIEEI